nr:immunoglobulin light chain junction region [Macaca mulatta]MOV63885.1 immunoglobulin light chain junction region [Macaca mulatta]MOV64322.1 immunoglobulin light chain junction region [Macaca mulatta]MOV64477.1 immunoglobulin light chain junction region [Macaca mulatta]MOV64487.1 immunoglobulin light chain junction region [Macaca mulatta]
CQQHNSYLRTF